MSFSITELNAVAAWPANSQELQLRVLDDIIDRGDDPKLGLLIPDSTGKRVGCEIVCAPVGSEWLRDLHAR